MLAEEAHFEASSLETSRPSGAMVALSWDPNPIVEVEFTEAFPGCIVEFTLEGGREASMRDPLSARSALFPTKSTVRFGDAKARASLMKAGSCVKVGWEVMS